MKLARYGARGAEKPALLDAGGRLRDLSRVVPDIAAEVLTPQGLAKLRALDPNGLPIVEGNPRIGAPIGRVGKFLCIGANYRDHIAESSNPVVPSEPILFDKFETSIGGPNDPITIPRGSEKTDWEAELAIVIGRRCKHVSKPEALAHVAGYTICNDVSERDWQHRRGGQWQKGKACDGFGPLGPWLVTGDEIPDPQTLSVWLEVNGKRFQNGNTRDMIFDCAYLISYLSQFFTLMPGDVISTGTPAGVGGGQKPPVFLRPGDEVRLGIDRLGEQRQKFVAFAA
jgi:2-keto-4-pentenoate hydratase/2-oxohepta-3-ene-1,7-dioic acid hydratase in catechol pathway